jgi:hypothetical protein
MTTPAALLAEIQRELAYRRRTYPQRVGARRMAQDDADYQITIMQAIAMDMQRVAAIGPGAPLVPATHGVSWLARVEALRREQQMRAHHYPRWINDGVLDATAAATQTAALDAVLRLYLDGLDWQASNHADCNWSSITPTNAQRAARKEWRTHAATLEPEQQKELAL